MRTLFVKNGYNIYLVDKFRINCKCLKSDSGNCEKFMISENLKSFQDKI